MTDSSPVLEQEQATLFALWRGVILVLVPGFIFVVGLITLVMPALPPISVLNGCYRLNTLPLIRVAPGLISVPEAGIAPIHMSVETGREGYVINAATGFSFKTDPRGTIYVVKHNPRGELIPAFVWRNNSPSLGLLLDNERIKIPKVVCPKG